jgi:alpha-tubulin suppressor-like RCC1 family protein
MLVAQSNVLTPPLVFFFNWFRNLSLNGSLKATRLVSSVLFVSLLTVGYVGGGNNNNPSEVQFKTISAGRLHSLALSNDGKVYAAGHNNAGQLGLGDNNDTNTFKEVTSLNGKNIIAISAGYLHSLALSSDRKVYTAGYNVFGQLGLDDNNHRNTFKEVSSLNGKSITALFAGSFHSLALSNDGKIYATGWNKNGQLGLGDGADRNTFTEVAGQNGKTIIAISAGSFHSLALSNDGKIYATGWNKNGQLGLGDTTNRNTFTKVTVLDD